MSGSRIGQPILLQGNMWTDPGNIKKAHRHMTVEKGLRPHNSRKGIHKCDIPCSVDVNTESSPMPFYPQKQPIGREGASISNIIAAKIHFTHNFYIITIF
jgi:hypothetical protein